MQQELFGPNVGIFVLGRVILKQNPKVEMRFSRCSWGEVRDENDGITGANFWESGLEYCVEKTRFGRIGIFVERKNEVALKVFGEEVERFRDRSVESSDKRAEKKLSIRLFETQLIHEMALEGYGSSNEFRHIARKFIRQAKNANCDTVYFPEAIFGEESTQKALREIAGTQMKVITLADVFQVEKGADQKQKIEIADTFSEFEKKRAAEILQTKLPSA